MWNTHSKDPQKAGKTKKYLQWVEDQSHALLELAVLHATKEIKLMHENMLFSSILLYFLATKSSKSNCPHGLFVVAYTSAITCTFVTRDLPMPSGCIFFCCSTGIHRPRCAHISFVVWQLPKAKLHKSFCYTSQKLGQTRHLLPITRKIQNLCRFHYGYSIEHIKLQLKQSKQICVNRFIQLSKSCGMLFKLKHYTNISLLKSVYLALFHSYLAYAILNWVRASKTTLLHLNRLQNKAVRILDYDKTKTTAH